MPWAHGTLRAIDQFVSLCFVSHPRCGWSRSSSSHNQLASSSSSSSEAINAVRLVWELVKQTRRQFAVGPSCIPSRYLYLLLKFDVSPLVLGILGDPALTTDAWASQRWRNARASEWVDNRRRLLPRYELHDLVTGEEVAVFPRSIMPSEHVLVHAVNREWFVASGHESDEWEGNRLRVSIGRLADRKPVGPYCLTEGIYWLIKFDVSPLVMGIIGDGPVVTFDDWRAKHWREGCASEWVDDRRRMLPLCMLHDLATGDELSLLPRVLGPQKSNPVHAVNHVWFVASGFGSDFEEGKMLGVSIGRLADRDSGATSVVVRLGYPAVTHEVDGVFFNRSAVNEVVAVVKNRNSQGKCVFVVIDVERSFSSQSLCVLSETSVELDRGGYILSYSVILLELWFCRKLPGGGSAANNERKESVTIDFTSVCCYAFSKRHKLSV
ncbi:hypothetical protein Pelo_17551 [Pelomyxa schiedti]|nr:hypothetical protein Pelo_17551 [Pelomyxa schiedti]